MALKGICKFGLIIVMYMENMYYRTKTFMKHFLRWEDYGLNAVEKTWIRFEGYETWMSAGNPLEEGPCDFVAMDTKALIRVKSVWIGAIRDEDVVRITDVFEGKSRKLFQHLTSELSEEEFRLPKEMIQKGLIYK